MFVGSWVASWVSLIFNSCQMFFAHGNLKLDVLYVAPVMVLLLGLFMTNLQGYLEEREADPVLAKAAAWDMDMALLLQRHWREVCAAKPPAAWNRLKTRQALGRGIPLSMVSFYLASRDLVEAPVCQFAGAGLGRVLIKARGRGSQVPSLLLPVLAEHRQICSFELPFGKGLGLNCAASEELNQTLLLSQLQQSEIDGTSPNMIAIARDLEEAFWDAAHCEKSVWMLQPSHGANRCGQEFSHYCLDPKVAPSPGPLKEFNFFMRSQVVPILTANRDAEKAVRELAKSSSRLAISVGTRFISWSHMVDLIVQYLHSDRIALGAETSFRRSGVLITSWRQWHLQFGIGLVSLLMSIQPLTTMVSTSRKLKPFQKRHLSIHMTFDILIVECTAIAILNAQVIVHFGQAWWNGVQAVLTTISLAYVRGDAIDMDHARIWENAAAQAPVLTKRPVDGLKVGPGVCASLLTSVLVIFISSTCLLGTSSVTKRFPLMSRWNAAVGGPFQVLGAVSENEVHELCGRVRWQILLRASLLSLLSAVFLLRATSFGVGMITSLVLQVTLFRAPFVIGWLVLAASHIGTGMLVVQDIADNQDARRLRQRLRDMEAAEASARSHPPYGTFAPQAGFSTQSPQAPSPSLPPGIRFGPEPQAGWQGASAEAPYFETQSPGTEPPAGWSGASAEAPNFGMIQSPQAPSPFLPPGKPLGPGAV
ncbi:unnamed protein product [Symbiodinium sp. CCMP2456]|nr:unnamed protein product [Symbiodinium sp. CCMP2456]